ncbi:MAG: DUF2970 domain-containing protein [Gammaproteobacteria bacterium]
MGEPSIPDSPQKSRDNPLGFFSLLKEILWSFLGVRSSLGYEQTFARARPRDIILVGLFATLVFVLTLVGAAFLAINMITG